MPVQTFMCLLYIFIVFSSFVKQPRRFPFGNSLSQVDIFTRYLHYTMSTWGQSDKSISAWLHGISTKSILSPGRPSFLTLHHPTILESSTFQTEKYVSSKNWTRFNSLPSDLLHNICMWNAGLLHHNKLKPVLVQATLHRPVICEFKYYKLHYNIIQFTWGDRCLGPHTSEFDRKFEITNEQT